jgi:hypothetical protein
MNTGMCTSLAVSEVKIYHSYSINRLKGFKKRTASQGNAGSLQNPEARKSKKMDSPLKPPERTSHAHTLTLTQ